MELTTETFNLLLDKIDALEKSMSEKIDALAKLVDQKIATVESANERVECKLKEHEGWLERHDDEIITLKTSGAESAKKIVLEIAKYAGVFFLAYVFYKVFPNITEVIK